MKTLYEHLLALFQALWHNLELFWQDFNHKTLLGLLLSVAAYQLGVWIYRRCHQPVLLHPVVTGSLVIAGLLLFADIDYHRYRHSNQVLYWLLGPATVALAAPLHREFHHIRGLVLPVTLTILLGACFASASAVLIAWQLGGSELTLLSLTPKSVSTPIALGIADKIGALSSLTTGVVVFTGVAGALMAPLVFRLCGLEDQRMRGIVLGLNAHGVGTARAFEMHPVSGAFASLAMGLTGAVTALCLPYLIGYLSYLQ